MSEKQNYTANNLNLREEALTSLLRAWKGIEPGAGFAAGVWRHIRAEQITERRDDNPAPLISQWMFWRPFGVVAATVATAVLIGGLLAFLVPDQGRRHHVPSTLSHPRTLAGSYLSMAAGESP